MLGSQRREHDVREFPRAARRPVPRLRRARVGIGVARRRRARRRSEPRRVALQADRRHARCSPAALAAETMRTFNFVMHDSVVAAVSRASAERAGESSASTCRGRARSPAASGSATSSTNVRAGDPGLPELSGAEVRAHAPLGARHAGQPGGAVARHARDRRRSRRPSTARRCRRRAHQPRSDAGGVRASRRSSRSARGTACSPSLAAGTSFDDTPLPTRQFTVGYPYVLDAFSVGRAPRRSLRGADARRIAAHRPAAGLSRRPGVRRRCGWRTAPRSTRTRTRTSTRSSASASSLDTLVGPILVGVSAGVDGEWRTLFGIGRIFR